MVGRAGSATWVVKIFFPQRVHRAEILPGSAEAQVDSLINKLKEARLI
jgi:hypothetical protein